jgi:hypothetical protein
MLWPGRKVSVDANRTSSPEPWRNPAESRCMGSDRAATCAWVHALLSQTRRGCWPVRLRRKTGFAATGLRISPQTEPLPVPLRRGGVGERIRSGTCKRSGVAGKRANLAVSAIVFDEGGRLRIRLAAGMPRELVETSRDPVENRYGWPRPAASVMR